MSPPPSHYCAHPDDSVHSVQIRRPVPQCLVMSVFELFEHKHQQKFFQRKAKLRALTKIVNFSAHLIWRERHGSQYFDITHACILEVSDASAKRHNEHLKHFAQKHDVIIFKFQREPVKLPPVEPPLIRSPMCVYREYTYMNVISEMQHVRKTWRHSSRQPQYQADVMHFNIIMYT